WHALVFWNLTGTPLVALTSRSKVALNSGSVPIRVSSPWGARTHGSGGNEWANGSVVRMAKGESSAVRSGQQLWEERASQRSIHAGWFWRKPPRLESLRVRNSSGSLTA